MGELIRIAALVAAAAAVPGDSTPPAMACGRFTCAAVQVTAPAPALRPGAVWPGEDKFRHVAMSWATMVFAYAAVRAADQDDGTALAIAVPLTAAAGIGKEIADRRRGRGFSLRDLVADAAGAGIAWLVLREVR